ncbi:MAG: thiamine pyrophosphate-dependent dehydrogenase E1 component subunit alpha [Frankiaceae bacterium]
MVGPTDSAGLVQLLSPEGERVAHPDYDIDVPAEQLQSLYRDMVLARRVVEEGTALQRQGELGLWASLRGQEAAQVGSARALTTHDMAFPTYREHAVALCRGVDAVALMAVFRGVVHGGWDPRRFGIAPYSIVIGSQALHAVGYALGIQRDAAGLGSTARPADDEAASPVAVAYFGDGASSQGEVNEAFLWASVYNAPVVFFCQNNQWAISQPAARQTRIPVFRRADGFGFPGVRVDGNDVLAVSAVMRSALRRARDGGGPTLIEAYTYRMGAHTTADDASRYRSLAEVETWKLRDPLERVKAYLHRGQLARPPFFEQVVAEADALAARLRRECLALGAPSAPAMFDHVYAGPHLPLRRQREQFVAYLQAMEELPEPGGGPQ